MKLNDLVPEAKQLLDEGRITVNHAIPIARLTPAQQKKVIDPDTKALFQYENAFDFETGEGRGKYDQFKARTVRELQDWIRNHVRFDPKQAASAAPLLFEDVAAQVDEAAARPGRGKKVVGITHLSYVQPEARADSDKTFREGFWKRADGSKDAINQTAAAKSASTKGKETKCPSRKRSIRRSCASWRRIRITGSRKSAPDSA